MLLALAPMDGITDCAYRSIVQEVFDKYGDKSDNLLLRTEFMTADGYLNNPWGVIKHLMTSTDQQKVILQIFSGKKESLLKCAEDIQKRYRKNNPNIVGIELNLGCPANNVMKSGGGADMIKDKKQTLEIVKLLSSSLEMPFSIKTRTGLNDDDKKAQTDFVLEASRYCSMVTIHGRTVSQAYRGEADWDFIYKLKEQGGKGVKEQRECKIIGNGGINSYEEAQERLNNLYGVMIGQGAIGNPWIFTPHIPSIEEKKSTILQHLNLMVANEIYFEKQKLERKDFLTMPTIQDLKDIIIQFTNNDENLDINKPVLEFRKHLFQYVKGMAGSKEFKLEASHVKDYHGLLNIVNGFFL